MNETTGHTLRIIVNTTDYGDAVHIGGPVKSSFKTFDMPCPNELSDWLTSFKSSHGSRTITGVELRAAEAALDGLVAKQQPEAVPDQSAELTRLREENERLAGEVDNQADEKRRRVYYQDIVYDVCNQLDKMYGGAKTVCGTVNEPSTQVQERMRFLVKQLFDRCSIATAFPAGTEGHDQATGDALFRANLAIENLRSQLTAANEAREEAES